MSKTSEILLELDKRIKRLKKDSLSVGFFINRNEAIAIQKHLKSKTNGNKKRKP